MLIKCPRCSKIVSTTAQKVDGAGSPICSCGMDLSQFDGRPKTIGDKISRRVRVAFGNGVAGGILGALFSFLFLGRFAMAFDRQWGISAASLLLAAGPLLGCTLAVIFGDRFLDQIDDLL